MTITMSKTIDFIFNRRTIAWPYAFNHAHKHRTAIKARADNVVRLGVCVGYPARNLFRVHISMPTHGKHRSRIVACLFLQFRKINRASVNAWRRACFQPALRQAQFFETTAQSVCRSVPCPTAAVIFQTNVNFAC